MMPPCEKRSARGRPASAARKHWEKLRRYWRAPWGAGTSSSLREEDERITNRDASALRGRLELQAVHRLAHAFFHAVVAERAALGDSSVLDQPAHLGLTGDVELEDQLAL